VTTGRKPPSGRKDRPHPRGNVRIADWLARCSRGEGADRDRDGADKSVLQKESPMGSA